MKWEGGDFGGSSHGLF